LLILKVAPVQDYARIARPYLPAHVFKPRPQRLLWLVLHLGIVAACIAGIRGLDAWLARLLMALVLGHSLGCLTLCGHEILHGSVIKGRRLTLLLGGLCFAHFGLLPRLWIAWHNGEHHHHTQHPDRDPDCNGTLASYEKYSATRILEPFTPGSGRWVSCLFLPLFFTFQTGRVLWLYRLVEYADRAAARRYFIAANLVMVALATLTSPLGWLFLYVLPLAVANTVLMSYIATNHFLNGLTEVNDMLDNSLTVRTPRLLAAMHMNFGYHVEHHLFPYVSGRHAPEVQAVIERLWGDRYKELTLWRALRMVYQTPRLYRDPTTLMNPRTGELTPTL